jgi:hypothetical protein
LAGFYSAATYCISWIWLATSLALALCGTERIVGMFAAEPKLARSIFFIDLIVRRDLLLHEKVGTAEARDEI